LLRWVFCARARNSQQSDEQSEGRLSAQRAGDCPGALVVALEGGDFELANNIKTFCQK